MKYDNEKINEQREEAKRVLNMHYTHNMVTTGEPLCTRVVLTVTKIPNVKELSYGFRFDTSGKQNVGDNINVGYGYDMTVVEVIEGGNV